VNAIVITGILAALLMIKKGHDQKWPRSKMAAIKNGGHAAIFALTTEILTG
jgi:hypothetical protein